MRDRQDGGPPPRDGEDRPQGGDGGGDQPQGDRPAYRPQVIGRSNRVASIAGIARVVNALRRGRIARSPLAIDRSNRGVSIAVIVRRAIGHSHRVAIGRQVIGHSSRGASIAVTARLVIGRSKPRGEYRGDRPQGDRPFRPRGDRPPGDRPFKPRGEYRGDRPRAIVPSNHAEIVRQEIRPFRHARRSSAR
jgi:hypothetical protein